MLTPTPSPSPTGQDQQNAVAAAPDLETTMREFWHKNGKTVLLACGLVLAAVAGKAGYEYFNEQREISVANEFAAASTPEKLKAFATSHAGHTLAGVAQLRLADDAYAAGKFTEASSLYQQAATTLKAGPMASRAHLGEGISKFQSGQTAEGETKLKAVASDASLSKPLRAEAAYHLASIALDAGRHEEASKHLDLINAIDPSGLWAKRGMMLRGRIQTPSATP